MILDLLVDSKELFRNLSDFLFDVVVFTLILCTLFVQSGFLSSETLVILSFNLFALSLNLRKVSIPISNCLGFLSSQPVQSCISHLCGKCNI